MLDIFCEVTFKKQPDKTSILTVKLDELSFKCMKAISNPPDDWVENIITSRCFPKCEDLWEAHVTKSILQDVEPKQSKAMLLLGYEPLPELIFNPKGKFTEYEIEVEIDTIYTKCTELIFSNIVDEVKTLICDRIDIMINEIVNYAVKNGQYKNKTKRDIIMEYEPPVFEEAPDEP
jgi:hypothetical protein|uniref:Uncharacterized protein n=1 Tax=viral metagenome TaxID=1070528 RepID=A0A6C0JCU1_9ZZZZ